MAGRLRVDLTALTANYQAFQRAGGGREVGAVVKADAYGLGASAVAGALAQAGCRRFFVATCPEGQQLRRDLPAAEIYVFEGAHAENVQDLIDAALIPVLNDPAQIELWRSRLPAPVAVHVDTGMSRLGFSNLEPALLGGFDVRLLMSHLACADTPEHPLNQQQAERFAAIAAGFPDIPNSLGNSAGWLIGAEMRGDVGRPGIGLYGGNPFATLTNPMSVVSRFEGSVLQLRSVAAGETIGYGASVTAAESMTLAVVGVGYADGLPRLLSNRGKLAWRGALCPIVGRVSMDLTTIDVSHCAELPEVGDWLECFGDEVGVDEVATQARTIAYEVLTGIRPRVERLYHWG